MPLIRADRLALVTLLLSSWLPALEDLFGVSESGLSSGAVGETGGEPAKMCTPARRLEGSCVRIESCGVVSVLVA